MATIKITKDGVSRNIIGEMDFAQETFPTSDGYSHEFLDTTLSDASILSEKQLEGRMWRGQELLRTDTLILLPDYPNTANLTTYRQELRDWPSTGDFPSTRPTLGS
ncbi:uncharacterized protein METZ01_LOCUS383924 [marine metagenome]|uniref:Phage tail assembly chaperone-like domain-containing protein n=1 Tax=marine metagenome TaxID=408172 RepID=A0A382U9V6_9ZZZZ